MDVSDLTVRMAEKVIALIDMDCFYVQVQLSSPWHDALPPGHLATLLGSFL